MFSFYLFSVIACFFFNVMWFATKRTYYVELIKERLYSSSKTPVEENQIEDEYMCFSIAASIMFGLIPILNIIFTLLIWTGRDNIAK